MTGGPPGRPGPILRARWLVPVAGLALQGGWLRLDRGRVAQIGHGPPPGPALDLGDMVILPGLVNAHTHLEFSLVDRPLPADGGLPGWIGRLVALRRGAAADPQAHGRAVMAGLVESLAAGVTALGDIATAPHPGGPAITPRLRLYREVLGLGPAALPRARAALGSSMAPDSVLPVAPRMHSGISPHAPYTVAGPLGLHLVAAARRRRLPVAMHLAESVDESQLLDHASGPFRALLDGLGAWPDPPPALLPAADWITLLARAPRGLVVHATFLAEAGHGALERLARHRHRLAVAVCPRTARLLSGVLPPVGRLRTCGVRIALGTDGRGSAPDLDPRAECRTLVEAGLVTPAEALAMATVHAAWGIGLERVCGQLVPGRPADVAVIATGPTADPHAALLDPAAPVVATLVGGRVAHGALPG